MQTENILISQGGQNENLKTAGEITLPDLSFFGILLPFQDAELLHYCVTMTQDILDKIKTRDEGGYIVEEEVQVDIPDIWNILKPFPKEEQTVLLNFFALMTAIVRHYLPTAQEIPYDKENRNKELLPQAGTRFVGRAWYSKG